MVNKTLRTITQLSLGLVLILVWLFMWIRADILFPVNTQLWKFDHILTLLIAFVLVFTFDTIAGKTEKSIFNISFVKAFPKFILATIVTLVPLVIFGLVFTPASFSTIRTAIGGISIGVIILQGFMVAIGEELIFRGWVVERLRERRVGIVPTMFISSIIFALFHAGIGRSFITLLTYIPLGIIFFQVKQRFSPRTNMANSGVHFAWNLFVMGVLPV